MIQAKNPLQVAYILFEERKSDRGWYIVTGPCIYCGRHHTHGPAPTPELLAWDEGRMSHCGSPRADYYSFIDGGTLPASCNRPYPKWSRRCHTCPTTDEALAMTDLIFTSSGDRRAPVRSTHLQCRLTTA